MHAHDYRSLNPLDDNDAMSLVRTAGRALATGDVGHAADLLAKALHHSAAFSAALAASPQILDRLPELAAALVMADRGAASEALMRTAVEATPQATARHIHWIDMLRCGPGLSAAVALCEAAAKHAALPSTFHWHRGYCLYELGRYDEALTAWNALAASMPTNLEATILRDAAARRSDRGASSAAPSQFDGAACTFDATDLRGEDLGRALDRYGCAHIRRLFDPNQLREYAYNIQLNLDLTEDATKAFGRNAYVNEGYPLYFASDPHQGAAVLERYRATYPDMLRHECFDGFDLSEFYRFVFTALQTAGLDLVLRKTLGIDSLHISAMHSLVRHMTAPPTPFLGAFHQDARVFSTDMNLVTMWFPLQYVHGDSPSLEILPLRSRSFLPSKGGHIDQDLANPDLFWRPSYALGDAVLFSGLNAHRSYADPTMTTTRISIDLRFCADVFPGAVHQGAVQR